MAYKCFPALRRAAPSAKSGKHRSTCRPAALTQNMHMKTGKTVETMSDVNIYEPKKSLVISKLGLNELFVKIQLQHRTGMPDLSIRH